MNHRINLVVVVVVVATMMVLLLVSPSVTTFMNPSSSTSTNLLSLLLWNKEDWRVVTGSSTTMDLVVPTATVLMVNPPTSSTSLQQEPSLHQEQQRSLLLLPLDAYLEISTTDTTTVLISKNTTTNTTTTTTGTNTTNTTNHSDIPTKDDDDDAKDDDDEEDDEIYCGYKYLYRLQQQTNMTSSNYTATNSTNSTPSLLKVPKPTPEELQEFYKTYIQRIQFPTITTNMKESIDQYDNRTLHFLIYFANLPLPDPNVTEDDFESIPPPPQQQHDFKMKQNGDISNLITYQNTNPQFNSRNDVRTFVARSISRIILHCPTYNDFNLIFLHNLTQPFAKVGTSSRPTNSGGISSQSFNIGTTDITMQCYRDGDYDFALMDLLLLTYTIRQYQEQERNEGAMMTKQQILFGNTTNTTTNTMNTTDTNTTITPSNLIISPEAQNVLENVLLSVGLTGQLESLDGTTTSYVMPCQIQNVPSFVSSERTKSFEIYLQIDDTENHTLMIQVAKYLINQLYYTYYPGLRQYDKLYNNVKNGNTQKLLYYLSTFMNQDQFYEYNSKPYQGSTMVAINLLHTYTEDQSIKIATQNILDMISVYSTVQADKLRRFVPFRRQPQYVTIPQSWAGDAEYQRLGIMVGTQNSFPEIGRTECIMTTQTTYRIDPIILDLFFPNSYHSTNNTTESIRSDNDMTTTSSESTITTSPHYFVGKTQVAEIYASTNKVLISSGGHGTPGNMGNRRITPVQRPLVQRFNVRLRYIYNTFVVNSLLNLITDEEDGWSRPATIIPRDVSSSSDFDITGMVRFLGHRDIVEGAKEQNLCVAPNFICGLQLDYGNRIGTEHIKSNCSVTIGEWTFWNLYRNETTNDMIESICPDFGYYMAVYERSCDNVFCANKADNYGLIEILEPTTNVWNHTNNIDFETFQDQVMVNNPNQFQTQGIMTYTTIDGHVIQFEIHPVIGQASIVQYDSTKYEREYSKWPVARSRTIQSTTPGRITIDNEKYYNQRLILDMTIPTQPRRYTTSIPILRYSDNTIGIVESDGRLFDDGSSIIPDFSISKVTFYRNYLFQLVGYRMEWGSGLSVTHGSTGIYASPHYFSTNESIIIINVGISQWRNNKISYMQLQTNYGRRVSSGYFGGRDTVSFLSKPTESICALYGRADHRGIYQLGAIYTPSPRR